MSDPLSRSYLNQEGAGVAVLASSGVITLLSIVFILGTGRLRKLQKYNQAHIFSHFLILLFANSLQAVGTTLNIKWVVIDGVDTSPYCSFQGAIKQLANVTTACFTFTLSVHLFMLIFLRISLSRLMFGCWMGLTWVFAIMIVSIGPLAIKDRNLGPFFGPSGAWCWITDDYPKSRVFLEYLIEYIAALFCFVLYTAILLRVRGNLYRKDGRWALRHLKKEEAWQLAVGRDLIDTSMLKVAHTMVWFPVAFTLALIPISAARIPEFFGKKVPFAITIITAIIFNLSGFINVCLLMWTEKYLPTGDTIPSFGTKRKHLSAAMHKTGGLVPFTVENSQQAEEYEKTRKERIERWGSQSSRHGHLARQGSQSSYNSTKSFDSQMPTQPAPTLQRSGSNSSTNSRTALLE